MEYYKTNQFSQDLLEIPYDSLDCVLTVSGLFPDGLRTSKSCDNIHVNTQTTRMGRPVNVRNYEKWKPILRSKSDEAIYERRQTELQ